MSQEEYAEYPLVSNSSDESFSVLRFPEAARDDARVPPMYESHQLTLNLLNLTPRLAPDSLLRGFSDLTTSRLLR